MAKDSKGHGSNAKAYAIGGTAISPGLAKGVASLLAKGHSPADIGAAIKHLRSVPGNEAKMFPKGKR